VIRPRALLWTAIGAYAAGFSALSILRHRAFYRQPGMDRLTRIEAGDRKREHQLVEVPHTPLDQAVAEALKDIGVTTTRAKDAA